MPDLQNNNWLSSYRKNVASQCGEDGVLEKIFSIISETDKCCIEFGAWDGKHLSNTWNLIVNKNWSGVLIEADSERHKELLKTYQDNNKVICINKLVGFENENSLDTILEDIPVSRSFDLLSIDIDGNDYHIWESLKKYQPRVVIIEFNPTIPNDIRFVQPRNLSKYQGSSLLALTQLGREKGYELVATTDWNAIFVRAGYFKLFGIEDNSPAKLNLENKKYETRLFQLYDGTLVLTGCNRLLWKDIEITQKDIQVLSSARRIFIGRVNSKIMNKLRLLKRLFHNILNKIIHLFHIIFIFIIF